MRHTSLWKVGLALAGLGTAAVSVLAFHDQGFYTMALRDRQQCSGPHCTLIATWIKERAQSRYPTLDLTMNMDTNLLPAGIRDALGNLPPLTGGVSFTVPVDGRGESTGHAVRLQDSPPITFQPNEVVHVSTSGLGSCGLLLEVNLGSARCKPLELTDNPIPPVIGSYVDSVTVKNKATGLPVTGLGCTADPSGTKLNCQSPSGFVGTATITLTRTLTQNFRWMLSDGPILVVALQPPRSNFRANNPFAPPPRMVSSVDVAFGASQPDLTIDLMTVAPTTPVAGNALTVTARVRNIGSQNAPASQTRLRIDENTNGSWDLQPPLIPLMPTGTTPGGLPPGATETETWASVWTAPGGTHMLEVCADAGIPPAVTESNETNNCMVRAVHVNAPPTVTVTVPASVAPGATYTATEAATDADADLATWVNHRAAPGCTMNPPPAPVPSCATPPEGSGSVPPANAANFTRTVTLTASTTSGQECKRFTVTDRQGLTGAGQACTNVAAAPPPTATPFRVLQFKDYQEEPPR